MFSRLIFFTTACLAALPIGASPTETPLPVYIFTDFGGGSRSTKDHAVNDWQTAIELASGAWKVAGREVLFVNDTAAALNPHQAAQQLAAAFPFHSTSRTETLHTIVVHVIDPGVGNDSQNPRAVVWRKDGVLFVGPDNGTLSLACPPDSIAGIWELDADRINALTGADTSAGGTFHGRDLFSIVAYLIAGDKVFIDDIGSRYKHPELRFRLADIAKEPTTAPRFQRIDTNRWQIAAPASTELFSTAYFLSIVQWPVYSVEDASATVAKQVFFIECDAPIAIVNRRTGNIFIGPDNGLGSSFFSGFDTKDVWVASLSPDIQGKLLAIEDNEQLYHRLLQLPPYGKAPISLDLVARSIHETPNDCIVEGKIWLDAFGNIKTTLTNEQLERFQSAGFNQISATLNGVTHALITDARSFAEVPPGQPFLYVGSSGAVGNNPHRSRRYLEVSSNGIHGEFGADLFAKGPERPYSGQSITVTFAKPR